MIRNTTAAVLAMAAIALAEPAAAQRDGARRTPIDSIRGTPNYDVVLEVPRLSLDSLVLRVDWLDARLAARARVANLVSLDAGVTARIDSVGLRLAGVGAQAYLYVDLDNVARIVNRVVQTLDRNPELVTSLLGTVDQTVGTVGGVANTALQPGGVVGQTVGAVGQTLGNLTRPGGVLTQTVNTLGQTVQTTLGTAGDLVTRTVDRNGRVVSQQSLGALGSLPVLQQAAGAAGQVVRRVQVPGGQVVEYVTDQSGRVLGARAVQPAAPR